MLIKYSISLNSLEKKGGGRKVQIKIKIFGKKDCPGCKATKEKFAFFLSKWAFSKDVKLIYYDLDTLEGLTEAATLNALENPTTIIEKDGQEIARWEKVVPQSQEFKKYFEREEVPGNIEKIT